jgi:hypothetical protein
MARGAPRATRTCARSNPPRLHQHLDPDVVGMRFSSIRRRMKSNSIRGGGKADLDFLEAALHQRVEILELLLDVHRHGERLVAVAQIDAAPDGGLVRTRSGHCRSTNGGHKALQRVALPVEGNEHFRVCSTICGFLTNRIWVVSLMRVQAAGDVASGQALGPGFWPVGLAWGAAGPRMRKWRGPRSIGAVRSGCWTAVPGQSTAPAAHARATHPLGAIG